MALRSIFVILALLSVSSLALADMLKLPAALIEPAGALEVSNCKSPGGGASSVNARLLIDNPMSSQIKVSFTYLDLATNEYMDQPTGLYCYIAPSSSNTCTFAIPVRMGKTGNGTLTGVELLRLKGEDPTGKKLETYGASYTFDIKHEESLQEVNILNKLREAAAYIESASVKVPCEGTACCGLGGAQDKISKARADSASAERELVLCNMTGAYAFASSAYANSKSANDTVSSSSAECTGSIALYREAKIAILDAESAISALSCTVKQDAKASLERAKAELSDGALLMSKDDYAGAKVSLASAKSDAAAAKISAKCDATAPAQEGTQQPPAGSDQKPPSGNAQKEAPLCPLGMAGAGLLLAGAYAVSKR